MLRYLERSAAFLWFMKVLLAYKVFRSKVWIQGVANRVLSLQKIDITPHPPPFHVYFRSIYSQNVACCVVWTTRGFYWHGLIRCWYLQTEILSGGRRWWRVSANQRPTLTNQRPGNTCEDSLSTFFQTLDNKNVTSGEDECSKWLDRNMLVMVFK